MLWERTHGKSKRVAVICDILLATAHAAQSTALGSPQDAPLLNEDAAMMTVDAALIPQGSHLPCTREDVRAAFTSAIRWSVAVYVGDGKGIVICAAT